MDSNRNASLKEFFANTKQNMPTPEQSAKHIALSALFGMPYTLMYNPDGTRKPPLLDIFKS